MTSKLLVVADLGRLRAYRFQQSPNFSNPRLELIEDTTTAVTHKLTEELTDGASQRKTQGAAAGQALSGSDGEPHNLELERRRRALKTIAGRIGELLHAEGFDGFYLATDSRIKQPLLDEMDSRTRSRIERSVNANLSKMTPDEVLKHFAA